MQPPDIPCEKTSELRVQPERGYRSWKRAKIEAGLAQASDRSAMIAVEDVLRDLKLEG